MFDCLNANSVITIELSVKEDSLEKIEGGEDSAVFDSKCHTYRMFMLLF